MFNTNMNINSFSLLMHFRRYAILLLVAVFLVFFLVMPVYTVVVTGCDINLFAEIFKNKVYTDGLINSLCVSVVTTLFVFILSLGLAICYNRYNFPGKDLCNLLMMLPMILPPFVGALGFQTILGHYGVINTLLGKFGIAPLDFLGGDGRFWSVCVIEALHLYPIFYLNLVTALGNIDPSYNEAATNLGASKWYRFRRILLPMLRPGILAGGSLVLVWSFTELGTPLMFGYNRVTPVQIFNSLTEVQNNPLPYSLVVIMLIVSSLLYLGARVTIGRNHTVTAKGSLGANAIMLSGWSKYIPCIAFAVVTFLAALPHIALLLSAFFRRYSATLLPEVFTFEHFFNALSNKLVIPSIGNSLRYSMLATFIAVLFGVFTALAAIRWKLKFAWLVDLMAMLPLAVPGIVIAFGYIGMPLRYPWTGNFFNPVDNPLWLLGIAYAVRRIPYVVRSVSAGLEQTPEELENAARNFGASQRTVLWKITLPLITANILVGGLFAFSFSMLEVSDSLILAQKSQYFPITRALYELAQIIGNGPGIASAFGVWAMCFLAATLGVAGAILGRKIGSVFKF